MPSPLSRDAVRSYRTVSPLPPLPCGNSSAVCSLLHFPSRFRAWMLSSLLPVGVRTFLCPAMRDSDPPIRSTRAESNRVDMMKIANGKLLQFQGLEKLSARRLRSRKSIVTSTTMISTSQGRRMATMALMNANTSSRIDKNGLARPPVVTADVIDGRDFVGHEFDQIQHAHHNQDGSRSEELRQVVVEKRRLPSRQQAEDQQRGVGVHAGADAESGCGQ